MVLIENPASTRSVTSASTGLMSLLQLRSLQTRLRTVGVAVAEAVGEGVAVAVAVGDAVAVGVGESFALGVGVEVAVGDGVGVAVGEGVGVAVGDGEGLGDGVGVGGSVGPPTASMPTDAREPSLDPTAIAATARTKMIAAEPKSKYLLMTHALLIAKFCKRDNTI